LKIATTLLTLAIALGLTACGGGGGEMTAATTASPAATDSAAKPPGHHDPPTGAAAFEVKGGDNSIPEFGSEASEPELQAAATALHAYLDARAARAWSAACSYLSPGIAASLVTQLGGTGKAAGASCPEILATLSAGASPSALREAAVAKVAALRMEADHGFLLFHGARGVDYFMPMTREGGAWTIAAVAPSAMP
jgi:hypothetical protein